MEGDLFCCRQPYSQLFLVPGTREAIAKNLHPPRAGSGPGANVGTLRQLRSSRCIRVADASRTLLPLKHFLLRLRIGCRTGFRRLVGSRTHGPGSPVADGGLHAGGVALPVSCVASHDQHGFGSCFEDKASTKNV